MARSLLYFQHRLIWLILGCLDEGLADGYCLLRSRDLLHRSTRRAQKSRLLKNLNNNSHPIVFFAVSSVFRLDWRDLSGGSLIVWKNLMHFVFFDKKFIRKHHVTFSRCVKRQQCVTYRDASNVSGKTRARAKFLFRTHCEMRPTRVFNYSFAKFTVEKLIYRSFKVLNRIFLIRKINPPLIVDNVWQIFFFVSRWVNDRDTLEFAVARVKKFDAIFYLFKKR